MERKARMANEWLGVGGEEVLEAQSSGTCRGVRGTLDRMRGWVCVGIRTGGWGGNTCNCD